MSASRTATTGNSCLGECVKNHRVGEGEREKECCYFVDSLASCDILGNHQDLATALTRLDFDI